MRTRHRMYLLTLVMLATLVAGCAVPATPQASEVERPNAAPTEAMEVLTVWHAWQQEELPVLEAVAANYQEETQVQVELVQFETAPVLLGRLQDAAAAGEGPDVFLGVHTWADQLHAQGIVDAYCRPDQCGECTSENPPEWCPFAQGNDFSYRIADDFAVQGLCDFDRCPVCFSGNPPLWCRFATEDFGIELDIPHATFAIPVNGDMFPLGIPIWWEYEGVFANRQWFEEHGLELPGTLEEALSIGFDEMYFDPGLFEGDPFPQPNLGDPSPQPNLPTQAGLLIASSDQFFQLQEETGKQLQPLFLEDYRPEILVHGAYMNARTEMRSQALDFIYNLADDGVSQRLFEARGHLPAHGATLESIREDIIGELIQVGTLGVPHWPETPSPADEPQSPSIRAVYLREFGEVCGERATEAYLSALRQGHTKWEAIVIGIGEGRRCCATREDCPSS